MTLKPKLNLYRGVCDFPSKKLLVAPHLPYIGLESSKADHPRAITIHPYKPMRGSNELCHLVAYLLASTRGTALVVPVVRYFYDVTVLIRLLKNQGDLTGCTVDVPSVGTDKQFVDLGNDSRS